MSAEDFGGGGGGGSEDRTDGREEAPRRGDPPAREWCGDGGGVSRGTRRTREKRNYYMFVRSMCV